MHCANPDCCCDTFDLPGGSLWRMELEESRDQPIENEDSGFPIRILPLKILLALSRVQPAIRPQPMDADRYRPCP